MMETKTKKLEVIWENQDNEESAILINRSNFSDPFEITTMLYQIMKQNEEMRLLIGIASIEYFLEHPDEYRMAKEAIEEGKKTSQAMFM
jgi:hypothetical protein